MKYRQPKANEEISKFASEAYRDHAFPKHSKDYHEISSYLELNGGYLPTMSLFDHIWDLYVESETKN